MLHHVLSARTEVQQVRVEGRHFRSNVVEKESLQQMRPVDFHGDFFKKVLDRQILISNFFLNKCVFVSQKSSIVQLEGLDGTFGEAVAL